MLRSALEEALSGQGRLVVVAGEPGIGKTRTAQELAAYAETQGTEVVWGRCYEEEGTPPYWPWVQIIRSYLQQREGEQLASVVGPGAADIAEIVPQVREKLTDLQPPPALEPEQARFRLFESISTFLKNAAQTQPLLLVLDDLHWADQASLLLLEFLAREMPSSFLVVVGTYRDVEVSRPHPLTDTLAQLAREPVMQRVLLRGLSQDEK
jgi:predicted ATPase